MNSARAIIDRLSLSPHPEGGWYRETFRAPSGDRERAGATAILFLLEAGQSSHWHKVDAAEIWMWHAGDPITLSLAPADAGPVETVTLGGDILGGEAAQHVIAPDWWQAARPVTGPAGYALASCVVSPAFEFSGFHLAAPGWEPGQ